MASKFPTQAVLTKLLYQALETKQRGASVYETAITCTANADRQKEWKTGLEQTRRQEQMLLGVFEAVGLDPNARPPHRDIVRGVGEALVQSMNVAKATFTPESAEIVAWEAVVMAEPADDTNWDTHTHARRHGSLLQRHDAAAAGAGFDESRSTLLGHILGWDRATWIKALGTAIGCSPPRQLRNGAIAYSEHP